jgi:hypothetical protein
MGEIFAAETARLGSFSLETCEMLKQLSQKDAQIFRHAVNLASKRKSKFTLKISLGNLKKLIFGLFLIRIKSFDLTWLNLA